MKDLAQYFPLLGFLKDYKKKDFGTDALAGITLGLILIPQGIAYAIIAGLPPIFGLYSALIPPIIYALFGGSRRMSIGAAAMDSLIIGAGLSALNYTTELDYISAAITVCFLAGISQVFLGILKFGFFANFLSKPVISGFTSAAAIIISFSQIKNILGISIPNSNQVQDVLLNLVSELEKSNLTTLSIGLSCIALLILIKKLSKKIPGPILVITIFTFIVAYFNLNSSQNVAIVQDVPAGFPPFTGKWILWEDLLKLAPLGLTIALVSYMQSISIAKSLQDIRNDHEIDNNREMMAIGIAGTIGSIFGTYSSAGGFSRSAVNLEAGAKSALSLVFASIFILITLLFLTDLFYYLPKSVISAIIITAILKLVDLKYAISLFKVSKEDFFMLIITFIVTLTIGIIEGLGIGVFVSIALLLFKSTNPHIAICGRIPNTDTFRNVNRFDNLETFDGVLILRIDSNLYFANIDSVKSFIKNELSKSESIQMIIIKSESINSIDSTSLKILESFISELNKKGIRICFSGLIGPVRDLFYRTKFISIIQEENLFLKPIDAIKEHQGTSSSTNKSFAKQHND